ncbi:MAG: glycosyltransferase family 2 protein [Methylomonas sp.]|jgi:glycosyltransferase involved in cell wall biosynthesis|uniref:glycosyltransferase family 2 protein n=1 Tax=Methylomonas sp. TaxID=418 RepID=UPI0025FC0DB8|nr:glycosyltransferase family 2 protein [Methylomonas sp.]MCK9609086.1 glycosyltransferase family 2 protein [Methylomonas sp.]
MKTDITAIILTFNESQHIKRCIESVRDFCSNIVVVDSYSTDDTKIIAENLGAKFLQNPWLNYANQFQWALDNASIDTEWVFRIDADEYVEANLKREIVKALSQADEEVCGFFVRRKYIFLGRWMRHGAMYPIEVLRLFRRGSGRIEQRWMDEHIVLEWGRSCRLQGNIVDDNLNNVSWWIEKHNGYATREMLDLLNLKYGFMFSDDVMTQQAHGQAKVKRWLKTTVYAKLPMFVRPLLYFLYRYFLKLGFLDGVKGFAFHFMQGCWYRCLVDLKMLEAEIWIGDEQEPAIIKAILKAKLRLAL